MSDFPNLVIAYARVKSDECLTLREKCVDDFLLNLLVKYLKSLVDFKIYHT